jgi:hypothetical protein
MNNIIIGIIIRIVDLRALDRLLFSNLYKKYRGNVINIISLFKMPKNIANKYKLSFLHNMA